MLRKTRETPQCSIAYWEQKKGGSQSQYKKKIKVMSPTPDTTAYSLQKGNRGTSLIREGNKKAIRGQKAIRGHH
jgi:hypothetical protein